MPGTALAAALLRAVHFCSVDRVHRQAAGGRQHRHAGGPAAGGAAIDAALCATHFARPTAKPIGALPKCGAQQCGRRWLRAALHHAQASAARGSHRFLRVLSDDRWGCLDWRAAAVSEDRALLGGMATVSALSRRACGPDTGPEVFGVESERDGRGWRSARAASSADGGRMDSRCGDAAMRHYGARRRGDCAVPAGEPDAVGVWCAEQCGRWGADDESDAPADGDWGGGGDARQWWNGGSCTGSNWC